MGTIFGTSVQTILLFAAIIVTQILGGVFLPRTDAFRNLGATALCLGIYLVSFYLTSLVISRGMPLSLLLPLMAAIVPLAMVGVGVMIYDEPASFAKLAWLVAACGAIGVASYVK
jgi:multidrug transporter EmrE-like cation transporter